MVIVRWLVLLLSLLLAGCSFDGSLESIGCRSDDNCPTGTFCVGFLGTPGAPDEVLGHCSETPPGDDDDSVDGDDDDTAPDDDDDDSADDDDSTPDGGWGQGVFLTEVYVDVLAATDGGDNGTWLELTNTTDATVDLDGWSLVLEYTDSPDQPWAFPAGLALEPGALIVLAQSEVPVTELGVSSVEATWGNTIEISQYVTAVKVVDADGQPTQTVQTSDITAAAGASNNLSYTPACYRGDPEDSSACWCVTPEQRWGGEGSGFGSPHGVNPECPPAPASGDLVITELMLSPANDPNFQGQWIEVLNNTDHTVSLSEYELVLEREQPDQSTLFERVGLDLGYAIAAHEYALIGQAEHFDGVDSVAVDYHLSWWADELTHDIALRTEEAAGDTLLDSVAIQEGNWQTLFWQASEDGVFNGHSLAFHHESITSANNNFAENWCPSTYADLYDGHNLGTPGQENPPCTWEYSGGDDDDATGDDDDATGDDDDTAAELCPPAGSYSGLIITEIFADPIQDPDDDREWFEVFNPTGADMDLACLTVNMAGPNVGGMWTVPDWDDAPPQTHVVPAGGYFVLGQSANSNFNGGAPVQLAYGNGLVMEPDTVLSLLDGSSVVDVVDTSDPTVPIVEGASITLDQFTTSPQQGSWCITAVDSFGDFGFGQVDFYGNPTGANAEPCLPPVEDGQVFVTEVQVNPQIAVIDDGVYFELYNDSGQAVSLFEWKVVSGPETHTIAEPLLLLDKSHVVITGQENSSLNGGVGPAVYAMELHGNGSPSFDPDLDQLELLDHNGVVIDSFEWDLSDGAWAHLQVNPDFLGASYSLSYDQYSGSVAGADANDEGGNWCLDTGTWYGAGGYGTPGMPNPDCASAADTADLIITEVMRYASSTSEQWVEVLNNSGGDIDLADYELRFTDATLAVTQLGLAVFQSTQASGDYFVIANQPSGAAAVALQAVAEYTNLATDFSAAGTLELVHSPTGAVVDAVSWDTNGSWPEQVGLSMQLDPLFLHQDDNDYSLAWCDTQFASELWSGGDVGTPGASNPPCGDPWYDGKLFCVSSSSLASSDPLVQAAWQSQTQVQTDTLVIAPVSDLSSGSINIGVAGVSSTSGVCDADLQWQHFAPLIQSNSLDWYELDYDDGQSELEFLLPVDGSTWDIEEAVVQVEFEEVTARAVGVTVQGFLDVDVIDPSYCSSGVCQACPGDASADCLTFELSGGIGPLVLIQIP